PLYVQAAAWSGSSPEATRYVERFSRKFGYAPVGYSDTLPHDAAAILFAAIREAGTLDSDAVVNALENGTFQGAAGRYRFDRSHQAEWGTPELSGVVIRWEPGGSRILYPPR
ncbi:MAG TPA: ABC transporter substrate-binding protein, partial [Gemmatimonadales bacterium]|nr:ABC transporter substrate-binding protein [Gemmatimonadales bacterium]